MITTYIKGRISGVNMDVAADSEDVEILIPANVTTLLIMEEIVQPIYYSLTGLINSWTLITPHTHKGSGQFGTINIPSGTAKIYFRKSYEPRGAFYYKEAELPPGFTTDFSKIDRYAADTPVKFVYDFVNW